ncbi:GGDEF domain-containing protein [Aestuariirhabdus litorea]|uniref:GGDEF domain-containing protein n=1 Tax=Aestuariirhabdus litorea TaxID=2528527 RepID=A0A3P3VL33_9GAMM|nr:GGDEF domain-containing protein [Aestuariirhabdus litorea]RRJ82426.1 GGDEF domain-containing protein [Aestuariirhabdus litorea]RWW92589.1 diguanylate cyclase [Endozoicomonadaceae bacterium GTF-13]
MARLSTRQVVFRIVLTISLVELVIMLLLPHLPQAWSNYPVPLIDTLLLALLTTPVIYLWVIQPFVLAHDRVLSEVNRLANTDPLTHLANRRFLFSRMELLIDQVGSNRIGGAVLLIDLDGFKQVNDQYGHHAGDAVLVEVAKRLRSEIRGEDLVGRLGGDEFMVLIHRLGADEGKALVAARGIADKLIERVAQPVLIDGTEIRVGASVGACLLGFGARLDAEMITRQADAAMYRIKEQGGKGAFLFSE